MLGHLPGPQYKWITRLTAAVWVMIIFLTIPFARSIQRAFEHALGSNFYLLAAGIIGVFFCAIVLIFTLKSQKENVAGKRIVWLAVIVLTSIWLMHFQLQSPSEAIHFFEYGILSYLLFRAWSHTVPDRLIYLISALTLLIIASTDEFIQWMVPGRYWDYRDIRLNALAGIIIQIFIAMVIRPTGIRAELSRRSVKIMCMISWTTLLILGMAFSNTPSRVDLYATRIPFLHFLISNENVMTEYGHRIVDPEIGVFYSRFTTNELKQIDAERGAEVGEIIRRYRDLIDYREFIQLYTSSYDPFLHEMRVHLDRRDHYINTAWQYQDLDPKTYVFHLTVADREDKILEKYFKNTLLSSGFILGDEVRGKILAKADKKESYTSPVSDHLVTIATESEFWLVVLVLAVIVGVIYLRLGRESRYQKA